jgi:hypothetical protein
MAADRKSDQRRACRCAAEPRKRVRSFDCERLAVLDVRPVDVIFVKAPVQTSAKRCAAVTKKKPALSDPKSCPDWAIFDLAPATSTTADFGGLVMTFCYDSGRFDGQTALYVL